MNRLIPRRAADTSAEAERVQVALIREAPIGRRLHLAFGLSATAITLAKRAIARARPSSSPEEVDVRFVELHYGQELGRALQQDLQRRRQRPG